jgi:hypothetical protein
MVTTAAAMSVAVPMSAPDLDHCVILRGQRRNAQPCGSRGGHRQRYEQCETDQGDAFHAASFHGIGFANIEHKFPPVDLFRVCDQSRK